MSDECKKGIEMAAKKVSGQCWSEEEKQHFLACESCQKAVWAALAHKRKTENLPTDADRSRPATQRALQRAREAFQREFRVSLVDATSAAEGS
jgi:hypothetical protein